MSFDAGQWENLPDRLGINPQQHVEAAGILAEVRRVVQDELTAHQRRIFVAIVVDGRTEQQLAVLFADPGIAFVHARSFTHGCYLFRIDRAQLSS